MVPLWYYQGLLWYYQGTIMGPSRYYHILGPIKSQHDSLFVAWRMGMAPMVPCWHVPAWACQLTGKLAQWGRVRAACLYRLLTGIIGAVLGWGLSVGAAAEATRSVPVIYCTDLFHPHDDPDDHFDLATLYAMPELDIKGIVLDQGQKQLERPGRIPVSQMNRITGRNVPAVIGLATR